MTHISEDLTHQMEGQTHKKEVSRILGIVYIIYIYVLIVYIVLFLRLVCVDQFGFFSSEGFVNFNRS